MRQVKVSDGRVAEELENWGALGHGIFHPLRLLRSSDSKLSAGVCSIDAPGVLLVADSLAVGFETHSALLAEVGALIDRGVDQ